MVLLRLAWFAAVAVYLLAGGVILAQHGQAQKGKSSFGIWIVQAAIVAPVFYAAFRYLWG